MINLRSTEPFQESHHILFVVLQYKREDKYPNTRQTMMQGLKFSTSHMFQRWKLPSGKLLSQSCVIHQN